MQIGSEEKGLNLQAGLALMSNFRSNWPSDVPKGINTISNEFGGRPYGSQGSDLSMTADVQLKAPLLSLAVKPLLRGFYFSESVSILWIQESVADVGFTLKGLLPQWNGNAEANR